MIKKNLPYYFKTRATVERVNEREKRKRVYKRGACVSVRACARARERVPIVFQR